MSIPYILLWLAVTIVKRINIITINGVEAQRLSDI